MPALGAALLQIRLTPGGGKATTCPLLGPAFEGISPEAIVDFHWHKHDGHWAAGANLYAVRLAEWLMGRRFWEWRH